MCTFAFAYDRKCVLKLSSELPVLLKMGACFDSNLLQVDLIPGSLRSLEARKQGPTAPLRSTPQSAVDLAKLLANSLGNASVAYET